MMSWKISVWALIFAVGAAAGFGLGGLVAPHTAAATAGDWLQFVGTAIGIAITIGAAVAIEAYKSGDDDRRQKKLIADAVAGVLVSTLRARGLPQIKKPVGQLRMATIEAHDEILAGMRAFTFVHGQVKVKQLGLYEELYQLSELIDDHRPLVERSRGHVAAIGDSERAVHDAMELLHNVSRDLENHISLVRKQLVAG